MNMITRVAICLALAATPAYAETATDEAPAEAAASAEVKAGTGVEKHEIVGEATSFAKGTTVFVWSRITDGPATIKHVWKLDGKPMWTATLPVKGKKWSTQSRRTMTKPGNWAVDVTDADGASLGTIEFAVTPGE